MVLTTRHTQRGDVMVEEFFDWIANRHIEFYVETDAECSINDHKLEGLFKSLNTLDTFGPSKRGDIRITGLQAIPTMSQEEIHKLETV